MFKNRIREVPKGKGLSQSCQARMAGRNPKKSEISCGWIGCMIFYLIVSVVLYMMVKELGLWAALAVTAISYPLMVLVIATILRMRGDITERSFIGLVFEGFKITHLLQKTRNDSVSVKPNTPSRSKKPSL